MLFLVSRNKHLIAGAAKFLISLKKIIIIIQLLWGHFQYWVSFSYLSPLINSLTVLENHSAVSVWRYRGFLFTALSSWRHPERAHNHGSSLAVNRDAELVPVKSQRRQRDQVESKPHTRVGNTGHDKPGPQQVTSSLRRPTAGVIRGDSVQRGMLQDRTGTQQANVLAQMFPFLLLLTRDNVSTSFDFSCLFGLRKRGFCLIHQSENKSIFLRFQLRKLFNC